MAVPKKRTGHSAQGSRRANWKATKPETTKCPNCGATVLAHTVCTECGTYKGQPVHLADKEAVKSEKPSKKATTKKSSPKKVTKKEEVAPQEVETVEETSADSSTEEITQNTVEEKKEEKTEE